MFDIIITWNIDQLQVDWSAQLGAKNSELTSL